MKVIVHVVSLFVVVVLCLMLLLKEHYLAELHDKGLELNFLNRGLDCSFDADPICEFVLDNQGWSKVDDVTNCRLLGFSFREP